MRQVAPSKASVGGHVGKVQGMVERGEVRARVIENGQSVPVRAVLRAVRFPLDTRLQQNEQCTE
jgi:hypothetical protein